MATAPAKWLHLDGMQFDPWVLPIWAAADTAAAEHRLPPLPDAVRVVGVHASTRLSMLPCALRRVREEVGLLWTAIAEHRPADEFESGKHGRAFQVSGELLAGLLLDFDSVLFELNSTCDLTTELFRQLHAHAGSPIPEGKEGRSIRACLAAAGAPSGWFPVLDLHRNNFVHNAAPHLIVDLSKRWSGGHDILIMNEGTNDLTDESRFLRLSDLAAVVSDFQSAMPAIQRHLVALLSSAGSITESG